MAHVTIPMSTSAPVSSLSHDEKTRGFFTPKFGSLKYADVSKVEVLDVNSNFTEPNEFSPEPKVGEKTRTQEIFNDTGPDAELDTSQFTATTDHSCLSDQSSNSEGFFEKDSSNNLDVSTHARNPNIPAYSQSPDKSIFSIDQFEHEHQPATNDTTTDWDLNAHNTPVATPVTTPVKSAETVQNPTGDRTKSISELERVVSDAVRSILDTSLTNSGEVSPQVAAPLSSPQTTTDTTTDSVVNRTGSPQVEFQDSGDTDPNGKKTLKGQSAYEESELEKAVEVDPAKHQQLIHQVINDEDVANCLISDAILADSIVALSSIPTSTSATFSAPSPVVKQGTYNLREDVIEENSLEHQLEGLSQSQEELEVQFTVDSVAEHGIDDEVTLSEKKRDSDLSVSDSELDPKQNLQSEMDAAADPITDPATPTKSETKSESSPEGATGNGVAEETEQENEKGEDQEQEQSVNDQYEVIHVAEAVASNNEEQESPTPVEEVQPVNGTINSQEGASEDEAFSEEVKANAEEEVIANTEGDEASKIQPNERDEKLVNGDAPEEENLRRPDGASEPEQHKESDLESTQDMTDEEENLRKASEDRAKKSVLNMNRKRSSQSRTEGFSENSIEDLRQAVINREAVIAMAERGMRHSTSDAVLMYQERKNKFDIRQDQLLKVTPNGTLLGALEPRPTLPTHQTRPLIGFKPGRAILVEGIANKPSQSFSISLQTAEQPDAADVAMLISPSFTNKSILYNTYFHDTWGAPQIYNKKFPFTKGKKFEIKIATDTHCFKVYVNGQRLLDYDHRMPVERVRYLRLEGDAIFNNVECPYVLDLPYVLDVDHGFRESSGVMLDAFVWPKASMFELNILCGEKARQTHASFMMKVIFMEDEMVKVEMASFCNDRLGEQAMVEGDLNIQPGQDFKLRIIVLESSFSIEVDGVELADYDHRLPIDKLGHVLIDGDISLYSVRFMRPSRRVSSGLVLSTVYHDDRCCNCAIT